MKALRIALMAGLLWTSLMWAGGCAHVSALRPAPPRVSIASVHPVFLSLSRQELEFRLRVANPNPFDLPIEGFDFTAEFSGEPIARGRSRDAFTLPANAERIVAVPVDAGLGKLLGRFRRMLDEGELALDYGVSGTVKLANWPRAIPFDVAGDMNETHENDP